MNIVHYFVKYLINTKDKQKIYHILIAIYYLSNDSFKYFKGPFLFVYEVYRK